MRGERGAAIAMLAAALAASAPASALIGGAADPRFADRVVMVLNRGEGKSGFCSGLVLSLHFVLTAAHCVRSPADTVVHWRDAGGEPRLIGVAAVAAHPLYRPNAAAERVVSIDLAIVKTAEPLDPRFVAAELAAGEGPAVGEAVALSGYGVARAGEAKSGGVLRSLTLAVRQPLSRILIWAADPEGREAGACSGDSGGPIWTADGRTALAIVAWTEAQHGRGCGGLTQGPLIAPQRGWIAEAERKLGGGP